MNAINPEFRIGRQLDPEWVPEAIRMADIGQEWRVIGRKQLLPGKPAEWCYCGFLDSEEGRRELKKAREDFAIVTTIRRMDDTTWILFAKRLQPELLGVPTLVPTLRRGQIGRIRAPKPVVVD